MFGSKQINRILIIKECCIGDVLMTTPLISSVKKAFPNSSIDYMVGSWSREVIAGNDLVDKTIDYIGLSLRNLSKLLRLRKQNYDLVVQCDIGLKPGLQAYLIAGGRPRLGFNYDKKGFLYTKSFNRSVNDRHEVKAYLELGKLVGIPPATVEMTLKISSEKIAWTENKLAELDMADRKIVGLFPGGGHNPGTKMPSKRWEAEKYGKLARIINEKLGYHILLMGSEKDIDVVSNVQSICGSARYIETHSIGHLAAVVSKCELFICNDCGPMHLAAAVKVPTLSIWGPTDPELLAPLGEKHRYIKSKVECSPCYKQILGTFEKCDIVKCMEAIEVQKVLGSALEMLGD